MPTNPEDKVLFEAEFSSAALKQGSEEVVKGLRSMKNVQTELNQEMQVTEKNLAEVTKKMQENEKAIESLDKDSKTYATDLESLNKKQAGFAQEAGKLSLTLKNQQGEYDKLSQKLLAVDNALLNTEKNYEGLKDTFGSNIPFNSGAIVGLVDNIRDKLATMFQGIDLTDLGQLTSRISEGAELTEQLSLSMDEVRSKMQGLEPGTKEFEELNSVLKAGEQILTNYEKLLEEVANDGGDVKNPQFKNPNGTPQGSPLEDKPNVVPPIPDNLPGDDTLPASERKLLSYRAQLQALKLEMKSLEEQGKENTVEFQKLEIAAAKVADAMGDQQQRIKILASDTRNFDFGLSVVQAAGAGLQVYIGLLETFGLSSDDAAEANRKLLAVMNLVSGAQQLQNLLLRESTIRTVGASLATGVYTASSRLLAVTLGSAAAASKALNLALIGTGIGVLIAGIGLVVSAIMKWREEAGKVIDVNKLMTEVNKEASKEIAGQVTRLEILRAKLLDLNAPQKERERALKEYNKSADAANKLDEIQINNIDLINSKITAQIELIEKRALARAAEAQIAKDAEALILQQFKVAELERKNAGKTPISQEDLEARIGAQQQQGDSSIVPLRATGDLAGQAGSPERIIVQQAGEVNAAVSELIKERKALDDQLAQFRAKISFLQPLLDGGFTKDPDAKTVENVFAEKLREFNARLRAVSKTEFESEDLIKQAFSDKLDDELAGVAKLIKEKKVTQPQGEILAGKLILINDAELQKSLKAFRDKVLQANEKLGKDVQDLRLTQSEQRIRGIENDFERERQTIDVEFQKSKLSLQRERKELLTSVATAEKVGLISPETAITKKDEIKKIYDDFLNELLAQTEAKKQQLAFKTFTASLDQIKNAAKDNLLNVSEGANKEIQQLTELYSSGAIGYESYQKRLTAILRKETLERQKIQRDELQKELDAVNKKLAAGGNTEKQTADLQNIQRNLREQLQQIDRDIAAGVVTAAKGAQDAYIKNLQAWVSAVGSVLSSVAGFWQDVNRAEQASLDRSISLQEKRVERAKELAEAGNAEYLELEQKRLDDLTRKREENARKQIAIDNALRLSQATLAAISAVAYAAEQGGAIAAVAAGVAIIGVIAAAYNFAQSLQPQEASFFTGTEYVNSTKAPMGKDTVKANLHIGERVVTANTNKDYWGTLSAIHNRKIPPEVINKFTEIYQSGEVPVVNYGRLDSATASPSGGLNAEVVNELNHVSGKLDLVVEGLAKMGVNVNVDADGIAISVHDSIKRVELNKRS